MKEKERIDSFYWRTILELEENQDIPDQFHILKKFLQLVFILPTSNASVERGFSQTKMFLESRESLTLKSLLGLRVAKEAINYYGGASNVPITPTLLAKQTQARSSYHKRLEEEKKEKLAKETARKAEQELQKKRAAEAEEGAKFESK